MSIVICPDCGSENNINDSVAICNECSSDLKLNNKYYLTKILGENVGITYLARFVISENEFLPKEDTLKRTVKLQLNKINESVSETVVIKELSLRTLDKWKNAELFKREGEILSQLNHKSIPKFIEEFEIGVARKAKSYIVMEYIDGISLRNEFKNKRYTEKEALDIILEVAKILDYLHSLRPPIVHRDIKLSNIMRKKDGKLGIIDFGSVKNIVNKNETISGTFGFMAPEQFTGNATQASDFYALGVVLLVLLTRKEPEELSDNGLELNWREYIYASDKVIHLLERLLENDPKKRIKTLKEIENILNNNTDEMVIKNTPKKEVIRKEPASIGYNTNIYQEEFKRIDSKFAGISEESNYKHWKGNLDAILGFMMFGIAGAGWWYYTWYMGLLFGFMFVIVFMLLTNSLYKRKARAFLEIFVSKIDSDNNRDLTFAILNSWGKKQDLGDEFLSELNSYITKEVGKGRIDIQRLNEYKTEIENDPIYQKFTETYIKELYPDS